MNDDHVSWRELNLALDPIKEDVREIKDDVKALRGNTWLGPRGHELMASGAFLGVIAAILLALFVH